MIRVGTLCLYERRVDAPPTTAGPPPGIELAVWDSPAALLGAKGRWRAEAVERLQREQVCAVALHEGAVVAYCWLSRAPVSVEEIGRAVVPGPDEVYLYDAFTEPLWRGRALFTTLLLCLLAVAHRDRRPRALIFVLAGNRASRRAIERAGFEVFATATQVEVCGRSRVWFRGRRGAPRVTLVPQTPL